MSFFKLFQGKTPEVLEGKGDGFFEAGHWGRAKVAYDQAMDKAEKTVPRNDVLTSRLENKIRETKEALAREHGQNANEMMEGGYHEDAEGLFQLALTLTEDPEMKKNLEQQIAVIALHKEKAIEDGLSFVDYGSEQETEEFEYTEETEYFRALCGTLPEVVQEAYLGYGVNFMTGYLALNRGDFSEAADYLARAMDDNPSPGSYVPLELATAYLNLDKLAEARQLLESFLENRPDALPAYQLLCEMFWEEKRFDSAEALLASVPEALVTSVAVHILRGETLFHSGKFDAAKTFYRDFLQTYGWNEMIARALAKTCETTGEQTKARDLYGEMMHQCRGCGARIDPDIKIKYAELSFATGIRNLEILELYLNLAQEDPTNAAHYYENISQIYAGQGNEPEARRFQSIAKKVNRDLQ